MVLPLASGEEGDGDEEGAGCGEAEGLPICKRGQRLSLLRFVDRHEAANRLPDLLAVLGVARGWRDGLDGGEVVAEYRRSFRRIGCIRSGDGRCARAAATLRSSAR